MNPEYEPATESVSESKLNFELEVESKTEPESESKMELEAEYEPVSEIATCFLQMP